MKKIKDYYTANHLNNIVPIDVKNIVIIGRTNVGKSTIKRMLVCPTEEPKDLMLKPTSEDIILEPFCITDKQLVINIIEISYNRRRSDEENNLRTNIQAMKKILKQCIGFQITKLHLICFAFSINAGIQSDDIETLQMFIKYFGPEVSRNLCLIITHTESKTSEQRDKLRQELLNDSQFKKISHHFERGIFFTGSINYDDYQAGNSCIIDQFITIIGYRKELLDEICKDCQPFRFDSLASTQNELFQKSETEFEDLGLNGVNLVVGDHGGNSKNEGLPKVGDTVATKKTIRSMINCPVL